MIYNVTNKSIYDTEVFMETLNTQQSLYLSPFHYFKKGLGLLQEKQLKEALQSIDAAIVFSENSSFYIYQKIRILYDLGALQTCSQLIVSQLEYLYKHSSLYILCRTIDYYQKINSCKLDELEDLLKNVHVPYCLARIYQDLMLKKDRPFLAKAHKAMIQDDYPLCIAYADLYLKLNPVHKDFLYMKAYSYHMLGELQYALPYYKKYLKLNPTDPTAYTQLGAILLELGCINEALEHFEKAHAIEPTNKAYLSYIGECQIAAKKYTAAIATYQTIEKHDKTDIQNYFNLSYTYKKINKNYISRRYLKKIRQQIKKENTFLNSSV